MNGSKIGHVGMENAHIDLINGYGKAMYVNKNQSVLSDNAGRGVLLEIPKL